MFQFLIGTIKTTKLQSAIERTTRFQFLIGTIKTKIINNEIVPIEAVSIPYRYYKNNIEVISIRGTNTSFNSL